MKIRLIAVTILFSIFSTVMVGQVTEGEKTLRTISTDTIQGWKKGGAMAVNLAQTSLTNWAAGGQNSDDVKIEVSEEESVGSLVQFKEILGVGFSHKF
jgi:hypothetical protein